MEGGHEPFVIDHSKTFAPKPIPTTPVFGKAGDMIEAEPEINDQVPTPITAVLALRVAEVEQIV